MTVTAVTPGSFVDHLIGPAVLLVISAVIWISTRHTRKVAFDPNHNESLRKASGRTWPWRRGILSGVAMATFYLLAFRGISFIDRFHRDYAGGAVLMSFSFLFLGPFVAGYITVDRSAAEEPMSFARWIVAPWIPLLVNLAIALAVYWERMICAIFILPPAMLLASLGGLAAGLLHSRRHKRSSAGTLTCMAILPLVLCVVEVYIAQPLQTRTVDTAVVIHATAPTVWRNIERVRAIDRAELRTSWANVIGFPRPVEATLSYEGVGGVRNASFEQGLTFTETITRWVPDQRIEFTIQADTASIPRTTLDEHVTVGGRFFDVLTGEYDLKTLANGDTLLHLSSQERLSTDFNAYAALWSDAVMTDMQSNILHVIKNRCEHSETSTHVN